MNKIESNGQYPIIEHTNNALLWPETIKGGIDLVDTYEVSTVPKDPDTPMETLDVLKNKGMIP